MSIIFAVLAFSLWQGEKHYVWTDFTNTTVRPVLVKPIGEGACTRAGVAMPVRGDGDVLYPDRVVWNGSSHVLPGESVRVVGELTAGAVGTQWRRCCGGGAAGRRFPVAARGGARALPPTPTAA